MGSWEYEIFFSKTNRGLRLGTFRLFIYCRQTMTPQGRIITPKVWQRMREEWLKGKITPPSFMASNASLPIQPSCKPFSI